MTKTVNFQNYKNSKVKMKEANITIKELTKIIKILNRSVIDLMPYDRFKNIKSCQLTLRGAKFDLDKEIKKQQQIYELEEIKYGKTKT